MTKSDLFKKKGVLLSLERSTNNTVSYYANCYLFEEGGVNGYYKSFGFLYYSKKQIIDHLRKNKIVCSRKICNH